MKFAFSGFWGDFDPQQNWFHESLTRRHAAELVEPSEADLLIYSKFGREHRRFVGTKLFFTAENLRPDWAEADFCVGFDHSTHPRYLRMPFYALLAIDDAARPPELAPGLPWQDREFCAFLYSHAGPPERRQLFEALNSYRPVESAGAFLTNTTVEGLESRWGDWRASKLDYLRRFRFVIACENSSHPGYTTEKLYDALLAGTIPIYWGDPRVSDDFDPAAFIDVTDPSALARVVDLVRVLDTEPGRSGALGDASSAMRVQADVWRQRLDEFLDKVVASVASGRIRIHQRARVARAALRRATKYAGRRLREHR